MSRLALTISYDGARFAGSQIQPGVRTVQAELERALSDFFARPTTSTFAGRTDRGVHAAGQVVGCVDARPADSTAVLRAALNARLPEDLAVIAVERRADGFHARFDARWREYRYLVWSGERTPLARFHAWQRRAALDAGLMARAASRVVGRHDFASLAGAGDGVPWSARRERPRGTVRTVLACSVAEVPAWWAERGQAGGKLIELRIAADGFLPRMVRNLVGAVVDVGRQRRPVDWVDQLLTASDRRTAPAPAPAHGLTFWRVGYDARSGPDPNQPIARDAPDPRGQPPVAA